MPVTERDRRVIEELRRRGMLPQPPAVELQPPAPVRQPPPSPALPPGVSPATRSVRTLPQPTPAQAARDAGATPAEPPAAAPFVGGSHLAERRRQSRLTDRRRQYGMELPGEQFPREAFSRESLEAVVDDMRGSPPPGFRRPALQPPDPQPTADGLAPPPSPAPGGTPTEQIRRRTMPEPTPAQAERNAQAAGIASIGGADDDPAAGAAAAPARTYDWKEVPAAAARNFVPDAMNIASGRAETLLSPIDAMRGSVGLTLGLINYAVPGEQPSEDYVLAAAQMLHEHYGSVDNLKRTIAEHPARVAATLAGFGLLGAPRRLAERVDRLREEDRSNERSTLQSAFVNAVPSIAGLIKDVTAPVHSPIETGRAFWELGKGITAMVLPGEQSFEGSRETPAALGRYFADRYGSRDGLRRAFAEDPAGVLADIGGLLTLGSGTAIKVGAGVAKAAKSGRLGQSALAAERSAGQAIRASAEAGAAGSASTRASLRALAVPTRQNVAAARKAETAAEVVRGQSSFAGRRSGDALRALGAAARGAGAVGRRIDPTIPITRGLIGSAAWGAGRVGAGVARALGAGTGSSPDAMLTAYRSARDDLVAGGERRAKTGELGTKKAFRQQLSGETPLDVVVNDARDAAQQRREDLSRRFTEGLGRKTANETISPVDFRLDNPEVARMSLAVQRLKDSGAPDEIVKAARAGFDNYLRDIETDIRKANTEAESARAAGGSSDMLRRILDSGSAKEFKKTPLMYAVEAIEAVTDSRKGKVGEAAAFRNIHKEAYEEALKELEPKLDAVEARKAEITAGIGKLQKQLGHGNDSQVIRQMEAMANEKSSLDREGTKISSLLEVRRRSAEEAVKAHDLAFSRATNLRPVKQEAIGNLHRHYGIGDVSFNVSSEGVRTSRDAMRYLGDSIERFQKTPEYKAARTNFLRANPEFSNEFAKDIAERNRLVEIQKDRSNRMKNINLGRADEATVQSIAAALTPPGRRGKPSAAIMKIARYAVVNSDKGVKAVDQAIKFGIEQGALTLDEIRDLAKIKAIIRPSLIQRAKLLPAAAKGAAAVAGALAKPISRIIAQSAAGAVAGGSRMVQRQSLRQLGRGFTTIPRELFRGTRAGWRGAAGARAGAKIGAATAAVKPIPMTTGVGAAGDVLNRLRTGSGPWVSNRTRKQVARDLQSFRKTVVETGGQAGLDIYRRWLQSGLSDGQKRALETMQARIRGEIDMTPGASLGAKPGVDPITQRETQALQKAANHKIDLNRIALAVDEAIHKTFQGLDSDPTTRRMRAEIGSWINEYVRQGESMHNLAAADSLLQRFDNAMASSAGGMVRSKAKDILRTARDAAAKAVAAQAPPVYKQVLDARDAGLQHMRDVESALSLRSGQGAESALRKLMSTSEVHVGSRADKRLRRQYLDSIGVPFMDERLAGIALESAFPSSATRRTIGGSLALGSVLNPSLLALALTTSPRAMGRFMSASGGVAGSRAARGLKGLFSRENAKRTRAAGLLEGITEDDPRNSLHLAAIIAGDYLLPAAAAVAGAGAGAARGLWGMLDKGTTAALGPNQK